MARERTLPAIPSAGPVFGWGAMGIASLNPSYEKRLGAACSGGVSLSM
jgi:hypothetical protein